VKYLIVTPDADSKILWENDIKGRILIQQYPVKRIAFKLVSGLERYKNIPIETMSTFKIFSCLRY
jgi:hypothetical protein